MGSTACADQPEGDGSRSHPPSPNPTAMGPCPFETPCALKKESSQEENVQRARPVTKRHDPERAVHVGPSHAPRYSIDRATRRRGSVVEPPGCSEPPTGAGDLRSPGTTTPSARG